MVARELFAHPLRHIRSEKYNVRIHCKMVRNIMARSPSQDVSQGILAIRRNENE